MAGLVIWGFPKIRGTFLGVPIRRIIVFWCLYWGPLNSGNYHMGENSGFLLNSTLQFYVDLGPRYVNHYHF